MSQIAAHLTSADLISSELSGCEATQFTVAATNQNGLTGWRAVFAVSRRLSLDSPSALRCLRDLLRSELAAATAN